MNFRRLFFLFISLIVANIICAQVPQAFHYQMVVRDANDVLVRSHSVGLRLTIQRNGGSPIYQETHNVMTDANGLLQIEVGRGTRNTTYGEFNAIPWGDYNDIVLISDIDPAGGTSYSLTATQPLQAVPYAFMADEHQDLANAAALGNRAGNYQLKSVKDPTDPQDVVTKRYLDSIVAELVRRGNSLSRDTAACINAGSLAWRGNSYSVAGTYTYTKAGAGAGGLDSVIILTLTIGPGTHNVETVDQSGPYTWHGTPYAASGTYTYAYTDGNGCPSVDTLKLTVSASVVYGDTVAVECGGFTWYGTPLLASGNYTHTFTGGGPGGVDSILRLALTIKPLGLNVLNHTDCDSYHWAVDGNDYDASGTYSVTYNGGTPNGAANGCDSVVRLNLTINNTVYRDTAADKCEHFTWYGNDYTSTSNPTKTFSSGAANGCDSTIRLALTIRPKATSTDTRSACETYDWIDGNNYTVSNNTATYTFTEGAVNGCDSTVTLNLTIKHNTSFTDTRTECDSYDWIDGNTYTVSNNTAVHHTTNVAGCDSAITLNLTLNQSTSAIDQQVACDSYTWIDGNSYTSNNNTATHRLDNAAGCDSNITLNLTVNASTSANRTVNVCGEVGTWGTLTYPATAEGAAYTIDSVNNDGCPYTVNLRVYNRSYTGSDIKHAYVCAGTNSYTYWDTLYLETFESTPTIYNSGYNNNSRWYYRRNYYTSGGKYHYGQSWSVGRSGGINDHTVGTNAGKYLYSVVPGTNSNYQAAGRWTHIWTPSFTFTNAANTYISFWYQKPCYYDGQYYNHSTLYARVSDSDDPSAVSVEGGSIDNSNGTLILSSIYGENTSYCTGITSWTKYGETSLSEEGLTTPGSYRLKFIIQQYYYAIALIDDILVRERKTIDISSTPDGSDYTGLVTNTNTYGCPSEGMVIHKLSAGETYTESACESYRWINGTTYTTNQTNTAYPHTVHGCSVTDHLNLTISSPASTAATKVATNNYVWATSGSDGHGTGLTYNYSGNYIGPYYATGVCQSRDTLHLTIENGCAGMKRSIVACNSYTWPISGVNGHGTGSSYSVSGTYFGATYSTSECINLVDTIVLTINSATSEDYTIAACDSYTWIDGNTYNSTTNTSYTITGGNAAGCDSTVMLHLTINASTSNTTTPTYCGGDYTWSVNGITYSAEGIYTYNDVNLRGCPHTENLVLVDGNEYVVERDTVCEGVSTLITYDTIASYDFEAGMDDSEWGVWIMCNNGWDFSSTLWSSVTPHGGSMMLRAADNGEQCYGGDLLGGAYRYQTMTAINFCWSAPFYVSDPTNTTVEFWAIKKAYNGVKGVLRVYVVPTGNFLSPDLAGTELLNNGTTAQISEWTKYSYSLSALTPGTYRLKFVHQDNDGYGDAIDDVIIYHRTVTDLTSYAAGTLIADVTTTPIGNGCNRVTGNTLYIQPTGTSTVVSACDSYTWIDNGATVGTYTASGVYTHSYVADGCDVTNTLVLTIHPSGGGNTYGVSCATVPAICSTSSYTWPSSGLNGHGTGQTYTSTGTYVGPNYIDANGCYARDTLRLNIE